MEEEQIYKIVDYLAAEGFISKEVIKVVLLEKTKK
mgnify:FL=1